MEGEGEADMKEESAEPRGEGGAKAVMNQVDDEAETGADRRCKVGAVWRRKAVMVPTPERVRESRRGRSVHHGKVDDS